MSCSVREASAGVFERKDVHESICQRGGGGGRQTEMEEGEAGGRRRSLWYRRKGAIHHLTVA